MNTTTIKEYLTVKDIYEVNVAEIKKSLQIINDQFLSADLTEEQEDHLYESEQALKDQMADLHGKIEAIETALRTERKGPQGKEVKEAIAAYYEEFPREKINVQLLSTSGMVSLANAKLIDIYSRY